MLEENASGISMTPYDYEQDMKLKQLEHENKAAKHYIANLNESIKFNKEKISEDHRRYMDTLLEMKSDLMSLEHENARLRDTLDNNAETYKKFEKFVYDKFKTISMLKEWKAKQESINVITGLVVTGVISIFMWSTLEPKVKDFFNGDKTHIEEVLKKAD